MELLLRSLGILIYFALMLTIGIYAIITVIIILKNKRSPLKNNKLKD